MTEDLTQLSEEERTYLTERIGFGVCVTFQDHRLPAGAVPARARIGIESVTAGDVVLHVDRGVTYSGGDAEVRAWLRTGGKTFESVGAAGAWLARANAAPLTERPATRPTLAAPDDLSQLDEVVVAEPEQVDATALRAGLAARVAGHGEVLDLVSSGAARHIAKPFARRPYSVMLLGPTGVGKTSIALALAQSLDRLTAGGWRFLRYDMAEFTERHSVSRLVGAAPGYVGYGDRSLASSLAEEARHVVLFDEMEKAHPEVQLSLMNLMDAGRLDSARHGEVSAAQALLVFTSNIAAHEGPVGSEGMPGDQAGRTAMLAHGMPRELVGRFGAVATLRRLPPRDQAAAAAMALACVAADYGRTLEEVEPAFLSAVLSEVASTGLGIRALEHVLDRLLGSALAVAPDRVAVVAEPPHVVAAPDAGDDGSPAQLPRKALAIDEDVAPVPSGEE